MNSGQFSAKINQYLSGDTRNLDRFLLEEATQRVSGSFRRQLMEERQPTKGILRMSGGGTCARKQWYNYTGAEAEPFRPRVILNFLLGDLCEVGLVIVGRLSGWQITGRLDDHGDRVCLPVGNRLVDGHIDGLLFNPEENEYYVLECKKMSEYGFREFEKEGLTDFWGYETQINLYMQALGVRQGILAGYCGNTGHICDHVIQAKPELVERAKQKWAFIMDGNEPEREFPPVPETRYNRKTRTYDPTGRRILDIRCSLCAFQKLCYPEAKMEMKGEKPIFVV